jgi:WD40 repeat protein
MPTILPGDIVACNTITSSLGAYFMSPNGADRLENLLVNTQTALQTLRNDVVLNSDRSLAFFALTSTPFIAKVNVASGTRAANPSTLPVGGNKIAISPDNAEVCITHSASPYFTRYDTATMTVATAPATLPTGGGRGPGYSPDGAYLAIGHATFPYVTIYDRATNTKIPDPVTLPTASCNRAVFSNDSTKLACVTDSSTPRLRVYNTSDWSAVTLGATLGTTNYVAAAWSPNDGRLAIGSSSGSASTAFYVYDTSTWTFITLPSLAGVRLGAVRALEWFGNDVLVVVMDSAPGNALVIDVTAATILRQVDLGLNAVQSACVAPGGSFRKIAGTVKDGAGVPLERQVRTYDRATGNLAGSTNSASDGTFEMFVFSNRTTTVQAVGAGENSQIIDLVTPAEF